MMSNVVELRPPAAPAALVEVEPLEAAVREVSARIAENNAERRRLFARLDELRGLTPHLRRRRARAPAGAARAHRLRHRGVRRSDSAGPSSGRARRQMSTPIKRPSENVADFGDENAFRRRRNHAQIEAMTGLILQAVGYPTRRHRDFICALQSTNSGNDARVPHTPFRRAHLTLADLMMCDGTPETKRKAVYREIVTLRRFQKRTGVMLFHVTPGSEDEATEYADYLTPAADAAVQRLLSSPLWKTDKQAAKREAVAWAVEQLPRIDVEAEPDAEGEEPPLAEYQEHVKRRILSELERAALKIEERGGDAELWARQLVKDALKNLESLKKTAPARLDHSSLRAVEESEEDGAGEDTAAAGGNTTGDSSVRPPSAAAAAVGHEGPAPVHEGGRTKLSAPPPSLRASPSPSRSTSRLFSPGSAPRPLRSLKRPWRPRSPTRRGAGPSSRCTIRTRTAAAPASTL